MKQCLLTPSAGKRLIGKGVSLHPAAKNVLKKGTLVIIAGTTNAYVAQEILISINQAEGFSLSGFYRGVTVPFDSQETTNRVDASQDVVIIDGIRQKRRTIFDVADSLDEQDVIVKGANAIDPDYHAGVLIGDPQGGTAAAAIRAVIGRRVRMIVPVGLEKRIIKSIADISNMMNAPESEGLRMIPLPGEVFTELDAISLITGATGHLLAGGGIRGAEGAVRIGLTGTDEQIAQAEKLIHSVASEPPYPG